MTSLQYVGKKFGRLRITSLLGKDSGGKWLCLCECDCGAEKAVRLTSVTTENTRSCGCLFMETLQSRAIHGLSHTKEYGAWRNLQRRCLDPNNGRYLDYGGRGITVCARWINSFENFLQDMGRAPSPKHSVDRINNNAGYSPENCRWATTEMQNRNYSRNRMFFFFGKFKCLTEWCEDLGLSRDVVNSRLRRGWEPSRAFGIEVRHAG